MAARGMRRFLDRWVTRGAQQMLLGMAVFGLLAFACWLPLYFTRSSYQRVDLPKFQERAWKEQPVGGGETETVAFLRSLGFEDQNIRIRRYRADDVFAGRLVTILAWIPQGRGNIRPATITAFCKFANDERLSGCDITRADPKLSPNTFDESTPVPAR
jgi:hypothetical protein